MTTETKPQIDVVTIESPAKRSSRGVTRRQIIQFGLGSLGLAIVGGATQYEGIRRLFNPLFSPQTPAEAKQNPDPLPGGGIQGGGEAAKPPETEKSGEPPPVKFEPLPVSEVPNVLDSIVTAANELPGSFNPRINQEESESRKRNVAFYVEDIKEALKNGEVEKTRELLGKGLKSNIFSFEDPLQAKFVPEDLKRLHDPKDKYIGKDRVDPRIYHLYFPVIAALISTDPSY